MINNELPLKNYEFHMSFNDVNNFKINEYQKNFLKHKSFTFHMPDYCDSNHILDFFSDNITIRKKSINLLNRTVKICKQISQINKRKLKLLLVYLNSRFLELSRIIIKNKKTL